MCAMCAYSECKDEKTCRWVCKECGCRLPGALGHGMPCSCPDAQKRGNEQIILSLREGK